MASPVDSARQGTNITTAATSHAINVGSPASGTLLIVLVRFAGAAGTVTFTGYTQFAADTSDASDDDTRLYYRWADGSEGATNTLSTTSSVKLAAICWEVTGAENPATLAPTVSTAVVGTAANINPGAVSVPFGAGTKVLDVVPAGSSTIQFGTASATQQVAESFVASGLVSRVTVGLDIKAGSPTDNVIVEIQTNSGGLPSGTVVGTSATVPAASLTLGAKADFVCTVNAVTAASSTYWIVLRRSGSLNDTNNYGAHYDNASNIFTGGTYAQRTGAGWAASLPNRDLRFATYEVSTPDALFLTVIGMDSETATATAPAGYSSTQAANSGTGGAVATNCMIWGASKQATATSDDPGAWTSSAPATGVTAWTIAIPPAAPAGPSTIERSVSLTGG